MINFEHPIEDERADKIGQYVVSAFEDSKGCLWFGTIENGVARYDGDTLRYFTTKDGLPSNRVIITIEDMNGDLWFGTGSGLAKFDGSNFINYRLNDNFSANSISQLLIDSQGIIWIGTWGGVYQFNGSEFNHFPLPFPQVDTGINQDTKSWITELKEDAEGNIWIGRDGYGACKYDGQAFTHFLKKDGLHSNNVTEIEFDMQGDVWFGTRIAERDNLGSLYLTGKGGVNKLTNDTIYSFPNIDAFKNDDVHEIHMDNSGNIWIATKSTGVYRYDGTIFENFDIPISIMDILDDLKGNIWLGGSGGLYRINLNDDIVYVRQSGPWE